MIIGELVIRSGRKAVQKGAWQDSWKFAGYDVAGDNYRVHRGELFQLTSKDVALERCIIIVRATYAKHSKCGTSH